MTSNQIQKSHHRQRIGIELPYSPPNAIITANTSLNHLNERNSGKDDLPIIVGYKKRSFSASSDFVEEYDLLSYTSGLQNCILDDWWEGVKGFDFAVLPISVKSNTGKNQFLIREKDDRILPKLSTINLEEEFSWLQYLSYEHALIPLESSKIFHESIHDQIQFFSHLGNLNIRYGKGISFYVTVSMKNWSKWDRLRKALDYPINMKPALVFEMDVNVSNIQYILDLWYAEPVGIILIPGSCFFKNDKSSQPMISPIISKFLSKWATHKMPTLIQFSDSDQFHFHSSVPLSSFLSLILAIPFSPRTLLEEFAYGYEDVLQTPLQPLKDHLHSSVYQIFEKDNIKYEQYEKAIYAALAELRVYLEIISIGVVGAGRGPLVDTTLNVVSQHGFNVHIYILDKNPNSVKTLNHRLSSDWKDYKNRLSIIEGDMRDVHINFKVDLLISELLGSFGDNELSPECLIPASRNLLKDGGICIPQRYTSYLVPISSPKLHTQLKALRKDDPMAFERPYVVYLNSYNFMSDEILPCFEFNHINNQYLSSDDDTLFNKFAALSFVLRSSTINPLTVDIHGFAGYFSCCLYNNTSLSIHPGDHTPDLISWFPFFFPLEDPIKVSSETRLNLHLWRKRTSKFSWYEWSVEDQRILNLGGVGYSIGLLS